VLEGSDKKNVGYDGMVLLWRKKVDRIKT